MKTNFKTLFGLFAIAMALVLNGCSQLDNIEPTLDSTVSLNSTGNNLLPLPVNEPFHWEVYRRGSNGGNLSCSDLPGAPYAFSTGRNNVVDGSFENSWPSDLEVSVTDGKFVNWRFVGDVPAGYCLKMAVIVKGGPDNTMVEYAEGVMSGSGLAAPLVGRGNTPDVSNLTFCWNFVPCDDDTDTNEDCDSPQTDTAFAGNTLITSQGWFYLMDYNGSATSSTLWAGQNKDAGTVSLSPKAGDPSIVIVSISLKPGFSLQQGGDNWYVHGYTSAPTRRPVGGQQGNAVTYAKGEAASAPITMEVPRNGSTVFAVHVNVQSCE